MLRLPPFEHTKAATLDAALAAVADPAAKAAIFAGGTDLLVNMKNGLAAPGTLVSIGTIPELRSISEAQDATVRIGACVTLSELSANRTIAEKLPALRDAAAAVASRHIRNAATLGGNVCLDTRCWYYNQTTTWRRSRQVCRKLGGAVCHAVKGATRCHAINSSDTAPVLMALDAQLVLARRGGERRLAVSDFYRDDGARHLALEPGEILTAVEVPPGPQRRRALFIKICVRKGIDFAVGSIAAAVRPGSGTCPEVRLVIGAMHSAPRLLEQTGRLLQEAGLTEQAIEPAAQTARAELGTMTNLFTSAGYKRDLAQALTRRALRACRDNHR